MQGLYIHKIIHLQDESNRQKNLFDYLLNENKLDHVVVEMDEWVMMDKLYINVRYIIKYFFHPVHQHQHLKQRMI